MQRNYFAGGTAMDSLEQGANFVGDWMNDAAKQRAGYRAAPRIAQGDYRGAAQAYAGEGMADEATAAMLNQNTMDRQGMQDQRQAMQDQRQVGQDELAATQRRVEVMGKIAQGLMQVEPGQRRSALDRALPVFEQIGVDPSQFQALTEDQLSDEQLQLFGAELEKQWQAVSTGGGGLEAFNPRTAEHKTLRQPYDAEYVAAQGQIADGRASAAARHRAPPRGRSGGGGKPAASGPRPTGRVY